MDPSGPSSAQQETGIQETVNPHAEEVKSLVSHPDVDQHAAPENINPKLEPVRQTFRTNKTTWY